MITKEQAKDILTLADYYAARVAQNHVSWQMNGHCPQAHTELEKHALTTLQEFVLSLLEPEKE